jgi:hypothetical protein
MFQNFLFFISEPPGEFLSAQCASSLRSPFHHIVLSLDRNYRARYVEKQVTERVEIVLSR